MQTGDHCFGMLPKCDEPTPLFFLRRRRHDEIEAVRELPVDDDGARKELALAVYLRSDVFTDAGPPDIALGDKWWLVLPFVKRAFEAKPRKKMLLHTVE